MQLKYAVGILFAALLFTGHPSEVRAEAMESFSQIAAVTAAPAAEEEDNRTPEERMRARFPQPVVAGSLVGLPVQDWRDRIIGYVREVVRTPEGKIQLIVPYGEWFGWIPYGGVFDWGRRPVAVPIEVVAILGRHLNALDMGDDEFQSAPTWTPAQGRAIPPEEIIQIAISRR